MRVKREKYEFTALFSNTAQAHELEKTHDWVVIYWKSGMAKNASIRWSLKQKGHSKGKQVMRGRDRKTAAITPNRPNPQQNK